MIKKKVIIIIIKSVFSVTSNGRILKNELRENLLQTTVLKVHKNHISKTFI